MVSCSHGIIRAIRASSTSFRCSFPALPHLQGQRAEISQPRVSIGTRSWGKCVRLSSMSTPPVDGPNDTNNTRLGNANSDPSTEATDAERYRFTESPEGLSDKVEKSEEEESEEEEDGEEEDGEEEEEEEGDEDGDTADDDEVSGSGESDSDSEDEDEEEPALKYARIDGAVPEVLKKDSASALAVSGNRLLVREEATSFKTSILISGFGL